MGEGGCRIRRTRRIIRPHKSGSRHPIAMRREYKQEILGKRSACRILGAGIKRGENQGSGQRWTVMNEVMW